MTNSLVDVQYWVTHPPRRTINNGDWEGGCEAMVHVSGGFTNAFASALIAAQNSGPLDPNPATARGGEMHYYAGVGGLGHVAWELGGNLLGMASSAVSRNYGWDVGTISWSDYQRIKGLPYLGHTFRHGTQTLSNLTPSGGGSTPITQPKDIDMHLTQDLPSNTYFLVTANGFYSIPDQAHADMVYRTITDGNRPSRDDIDYVNSLLLGTRYNNVSPIPQGGAGNGNFTDADRAQLNSLPSDSEIGTALTSMVSLVNQHADTNKDAIIAAIPSAPGGAVGDLSITLTGTATQK